MSDFDASKFQALKESIADTPPYCGGILTVPRGDLAIFYRGRNDVAHLSFAEASESQLEHLSQACQPATFGLNQKDVYDESYRKAGKLDEQDFASKFILERSGLLDIVRSELLEGQNNKAITAELYKLNVYGQGSFFKSHKDTPRGDTMFGSLVIVFPTPHEGGALMLRHGGHEWTFDSGKELAGLDNPSIGYVAFFGDVEHEVTPVQSGHRFTLTYNLFFAAETSSPTIIQHPSATESTFKDALVALLADPTVFPDGGNLGFGLRHEYPINAKTNLVELLSYLKGSDALIARICNDLSLTVTLKVVYNDDDYDHDIMTDQIAQLDGANLEGAITEELRDRYKGAKIRSLGRPACDEENWEKNRPKWKKDVEVYWVTEMASLSKVKQDYIAYGNESWLAHTYGHVCLILSVGPAGNRTAADA